MRHWNRGKKTVRNFLLALLLVFLIYASQGFPPYTVKGICRQVRHDYLLGELEPLYVQRDWRHPSANRYERYTTVAARCGETYTIFRYADGLLGSHRDWSDLSPVFGEGAVCVARGGKIYAAGPFAEAATAVAVVRAEKPPAPNGNVECREFTLEGERLANQVFVFPYETDYSSFEGEHMGEEDLVLPAVVEMWYRKPAPNADPGLYYFENKDLPCTVTLYSETGEALETFDLTVTTEGIRSWW